ATATATPATAASATTTSDVRPTTIRPTSSVPRDQVHHTFPIPSETNASYGHSHAEYPATDIFARCGSTYLSPVDGTVTEVRKVDRYDATVDNPALRGGRSVAIVGDDGVRYYGAHFQSIPDSTVAGERVHAGDPIAVV